jgi:hypothetical protein
MPTVLDRFLRYVRYDTQSDESSSTYPSTDKQLVLLRDLADELRALGCVDAAVDAHGYVMATIPKTTSKPNVPTIGFIAHVDTSPEMPGAGVKPIVHRNFDGRDLVLPDDPTAVLRISEIPRAGRSNRLRHRHRIGDDVARRRQQVRRRGNCHRRRVPAGPSRNSAWADPHRLYTG